MTALNRAAAVYIGDKAAQRIYLGAQLVWERATGPALPPVTAGLLWHTDTPIAFAETGAAVPPIAMPRAAGPLYVVISYHQAATAESETAVFYVGDPTDNLWLTNTFYVQRDWGTGIAVYTSPGAGKLVSLPEPPSDFVGEIWAAATGANMVDHAPGTTSWYMDPIPNHNPVATSHLFVGYKPQDGNPAWRGAGTIRRMAIYDRVPSETERGQLVAWVQG